MIVCSLALSALAAAYTVTREYHVMLGLAIVHGCFLSGLLCSASAYMTDFMPAARRAEGIGYCDLSTMLALAVAPSLGFWLYRGGGWMWLCASIGTLFLAAAAIAFRLAEVTTSEPAPKPFFERDLIEWRVLALSLTLFLCSFGYRGDRQLRCTLRRREARGAEGDLLDHIGIVVVCTRPFLVSLGDPIGHRRVFLPCLALIVGGLSLLAASDEQDRHHSGRGSVRDRLSAPRTSLYRLRHAARGRAAARSSVRCHPRRI